MGLIITQGRMLVKMKVSFGSMIPGPPAASETLFFLFISLILLYPHQTEKLLVSDVQAVALAPFPARLS